MHVYGNRTPIPPIDLTRVTEETRRALYDAVVEIHFRPTPEEVRRTMEDPENHWVPTYGPDEAGLVVYYDRGRWYAAWRSLEEGPDAAPERRWTVLRIVTDPDSPLGGLAFLEV